MNPGRLVIGRAWTLLVLMAFLGLPPFFLRATGAHLSPALTTILFGGAIVGAAFLLSWAAEVAELDISQALALAFVALIAVLPEYAVDGYFAWQAGAQPDSPYVHYATANMTGGNRLLVGLGWPLVALLFWFTRRRTLHVEEGLTLELAALAVATLYAFSIPLKGSISLVDTVVLGTVFALYIYLSARAEMREPELVGPAAAIATLRTGARRSMAVLLFLYAAAVIVLSTEPFAEGLLDVGKGLGVDEFIMVQWVAPLASESPEILVAVVLTMRHRAAAAMTALISAKVNQWTLLVGTLPVIYSVSLGSLGGLALDARQAEEVLLTAAQSLFAVVLLLTNRLSWRGAGVLFVLFFGQLLFPSTQVRLGFAYGYLALTGLLLVVQPYRLRLARRLLPDLFRLVRGQG